MGKFAIYLRRSSPGEEDKNYSIEDQQRDVEQRWPEYLSHTLTKIYKDPGGKSYTLARPVFRQLMQDAKAGLFEIVVVGKWDRFSRIQDQQAVATYQLQQYGVRVVSATQPIPDGPMGTLIRNNYAFAAELELYNIRERTYGGKKARVRKGKLPPQSVPLYGYLFEDPKTKERYVVDDETATVVRMIYDWVLHGMKLRAIARKLSETGVPTPTQLWERRGWGYRGNGPSRTWSHATLYNILTNPAYIGKHVGFKKKVQMAERRHPITGETLVVKTQVLRDETDQDRIAYDQTVCPPIIKEAAFHAVQEILRRNKEESSRNLHDPSAILLRNGFAVCGYCNGRMSAQWSAADKQYRYMCSGPNREPPTDCSQFSWRASDMDDIAWRWIIEQFEHPESMRQKYEMWKADRVDGRSIEQDRLKSIEDQIALLERKRLNNMDMAEDEDNPTQRAEYQLRAKEAAKRIRNLTDERDTLSGILSRDEGQESAIDTLVQLGPAAIGILREADFEAKRRCLWMLDLKVIMWAHDDPRKYHVGWGFDRLYERWVAEKAGNGADSGDVFCVQDHLWSKTQNLPRFTWTAAEIQAVLGKHVA